MLKKHDEILTTYIVLITNYYEINNKYPLTNDFSKENMSDCLIIAS